jgi:hypothetical protein
MHSGILFRFFYFTVAAEELPDGEYGNELLQSVPNSWWPF